MPPTTPPMIFLEFEERPEPPLLEPLSLKPGVEVLVAKPVDETTDEETTVVDTTWPPLSVVTMTVVS